jgi:protein-export membrane protein SecD
MAALAATAGPTQDAVEIRETGDGAVRLVPSGRAIGERLNLPLDKAVDIIRLRLEGSGFTSAAVRREGTDRILVIAPGLFSPEQLVPLLATVSRLEFRLVDDSTTAGADSEVLFGFKTHQRYVVYKQSAVDGADIVDARPMLDQSGRPAIDFRFTARGAREFGRLTQENVGRAVAIVLDGQVLSAPIIRTPILGGYGQITGPFTVEEANRLAVMLRAGALPVKLILVERTTVQPASKN